MRQYYEEAGEGQTMVLLHGNGEDTNYFRAQIDYFSKDYHVVVVDTRGHGKSPRGTAPFTLVQFAKDLKHLLDKKGWRNIVLLGFSDGANIAMLFSVKYPGYVSKLILDGGDLYPSGVRMVYQLPVICEYFYLKIRSSVDKSVKGKCELFHLMVAQPHIKTKYLKELTMPVLVMAGNHDMIRRSHTEKIFRTLPNAQLVIIEGDHFIAAKQSAVFNKEAEGFLNQF